MITRCGDDCTYCPRFVGARDGDPIKPEEAKDLWSRLGLRGKGVLAEQMLCHGCLPQNDCAYPELRACAKARGYENCGSCDEYPCTLTMAMFAKTHDLATRAEQVCTQTELRLLRKAFFSKKIHLDRTHRTRPGAALGNSAGA